MLRDDLIDELVCPFGMGPYSTLVGRDEIHKAARAVEKAAYEAAIRAIDGLVNPPLLSDPIQAWVAGNNDAINAIRSLTQEQPK